MDIGAVFGTNSGTIALVLTGALIYGTGYAIIVSYLRRNGRLDGFTSFAVVLGVIATLLLATPVIGIPAALFTGLVFVGTGLPMMIEDIWTYTSSRRSKDAAVRKLYKDGNGGQ